MSVIVPSDVYPTEEGLSLTSAPSVHSVVSGSLPLRSTDAVAVTAAASMPHTDNLPAALKTRPVQGVGSRPPLAGSTRKESLSFSARAQEPTAERAPERFMVDRRASTDPSRHSVHGALAEESYMVGDGVLYPTESDAKTVNAARKQSHYMAEAASRTSIHGALSEPAESDAKTVNAARKQSHYMAEAASRTSIHGALNEPAIVSDATSQPKSVMEARRASRHLGAGASETSVHAQLDELPDQDADSDSQSGDENEEECGAVTLTELLEGRPDDSNTRHKDDEKASESVATTRSEPVAVTDRRRTSTKPTAGGYVPAYHPHVSAVAIDLDSVSAFSGEVQEDGADLDGDEEEWYWEEVEEEVEESEEEEEEGSVEDEDKEENSKPRAARMPSKDRNSPSPARRGVEKGTNTVCCRDEASQTVPYTEMVVYGPFPDALMNPPTNESTDERLKKTRREKGRNKSRSSNKKKSGRAKASSGTGTTRAVKTGRSRRRRGVRGHRRGWKCRSTKCDICHPWQEKIEAARAADRAGSSVHAHRYCDYCGPVAGAESWATPWNETTRSHPRSAHRSSQRLLRHRADRSHDAYASSYPLLPPVPERVSDSCRKVASASSAGPYLLTRPHGAVCGSAPAASRALRLVNSTMHSANTTLGSDVNARPNSGYRMPSRPTHPHSGYNYDTDTTYRYCDLTTGMMMLHRRGCPHDEPLYEYNDTVLGQATSPSAPEAGPSSGAAAMRLMPSPPPPRAPALPDVTPPEQRLRPLSPSRPIMSPSELGAYIIDDTDRAARAAAPEPLEWGPESSGSARRPTSSPAAVGLLPALTPSPAGRSPSIYSPASTSLAHNGDVLMYNGRPFYNRVILKQQIQRNRQEEDALSRTTASAEGYRKTYAQSPEVAAAPRVPSLPQRVSRGGSDPVLYTRDMSRAAYRQRTYADEL